MKRLMVSASAAVNSLPAGYERKSEAELQELGYDMDPEYVLEDKELCAENGLEFVGYAVNDDDEFAVVARDEGVLKCFEISAGRMFEIE